MPLKAKIIDPRVASRAQMSTKASKAARLAPGQVSDVIRERPADAKNDVLFNSLYGLRTIELNRPAKLNSLDGSMVRKIAPRLIEWEKSDMANIIVIKGAGEKAFCAGGDVKALALQNKKGPKGQKESSDFFGLEYKLDHYIATYKKPYVAFMDGITMGGGVGLTVHAPIRIATEKTVFAMPETTIGFFPDVGASFFLPRMAGSVGTYLALTSERLTGANVFYSGIATHYIHSTSLPSLEARLSELQFRDDLSKRQRLEIIADTINDFATGLPHDVPIKLGGELREAIDRCFSKPTIPDILRALEAEQGSTKAWAEKTLVTLRRRSPIAVHVTLDQMQVGRNWSIAETFQKEHHIASKFMEHPDFVEGVSCLLISEEKPKPEPKWQPATLEDVQPGPDVSPFFNMPTKKDQLELLCDRDYKEYPFAEFGIPSETEVQELLQPGRTTRREAVEHFVQSRKGRQGVDVIVNEILKRKTRVNEEGKAIWTDA